MFSTFLAAVIAVISSFMFPVTLTLAEASSDLSAPQGIAEVLSTLLGNIVANPIDSLVNANYIGVLFWAVLIGIGMRAAGETSKNILNDVSKALSKGSYMDHQLCSIRYPWSGVQYRVHQWSFHLHRIRKAAGSSGWLHAVYLLCDKPDPGILVYSQNPYPLIFKCLKKSAITAFFTRSSAANIPINMEACEEMGLDKDTYSVTIPLCATINMDGAAITITVMALCNRSHTGNRRGYPKCSDLKCAGSSVRMRCIRCSRWISSSDPHGMLLFGIRMM